MKAELLCVDPWELQDVTLGPTSQRMNMVVEDDFAYHLFPHNVSFASDSVRVRHFRGTSRELLPHLRDGSYDLIYIDGSHLYDDVLLDIREAKRLVAADGIICGDDLELQVHQLDPQLRETADRFINDSDGSARHYETQKGNYPPIHEGATFAVAEEFGEVTEVVGYWLMRENAGEFQKVENDVQVLIPRHLWPEDQVKFRGALAGLTS